MKGRIFTIAACLALAACGGEEAEQGSSEAGLDSLAPAPENAAAPAPNGSPATAVVRDASGRDLGSLTLVDVGGAIEVAGTLTGLAPGTHGIHLHTVGRCEPDFAAAGDHWNPGAQPHGRPGSGHRGDLENITAGADSTATVRVMTGAGASLRGDTAPDALLDADGGSVVVHASADDYTTQPSGASGDRIACGAVQG